MKHSVLLVEDDLPTRERLAHAIDVQPGLELVASVGTFAEGRQALAARRPRVLLTDLGLPDGNGLELIAEAATRYAGTESMVITVFGDEHHVVRAIRAGARGYLLKDSPVTSIGNDIQLLIEGGSPINPKVARYLLNHFREGAPGAAAYPEVALTDRERSVLQLIAKGYRRNEIAAKLNITGNTVGTHITKIYGKLSVHSNVEAAQKAIQLGLVR